MSSNSQFRARFERTPWRCYNLQVPHALSESAAVCGLPAQEQRAAGRMMGPKLCAQDAERSGQVAQVVERSPEKAGVGGSTPSLATIIPKNLATESRIFQPTIQPMILTELGL